MARSSVAARPAHTLRPAVASGGSRFRSLAIVAAAVGAGSAAYLLVEYTTGQPGICLTGSGCDAVRASAFAYPLGLPMPLYGLGFFLAAAWLAARTLSRRPLLGVSPRPALVGLAAAGVVVSAILTAFEAFIIQAFCTWCLASAAASVALLAASIGLWRVPVDTAEGGRSGKVRQVRARAMEDQRSSVRRTVVTTTALTGLVVGALLLGGAAPRSGSPVDTGEAARLAPGTSPRIGSGAVTIVEFADFQCPACAVVGPMLADLAASDEATLVYRYFPLTAIHANAEASARAAAAADRQDAFWPMAERLFAEQQDWQNLGGADADAYFADLAGVLGLDVDRWAADYASAGVRRAVADDAALAQELNLPGTPTIFVNGKLYTGERSPQALRAAIAQAVP